MHEMSEARAQGGLEVIRFGFGQSPFPPPDSIIKALQDNAHEHFYAPVAGLLELRKTVAAYYTNIEGLKVDFDQILVSAGSKALLFAAMAAFEDANILIPAPAWVSYAPQAQLLGQNIVPVETSYDARWRVTPEYLERALKRVTNSHQSMLVLTYPGNPDGLGYDEASLRVLAEVARENDLLILSDEIYGPLNFRGAHTSIAKFYPEGSIVTGGLSKWCGAGGWRLGVSIIPEELKSTLGATMIGILSEIVSCAPTPVQLAAIEAYKFGPEMQNDLKIKRRILKTLGLYGAAKLRDAGIDVVDPEGGFYLFVDFEPFREKLKKRGVETGPHLCQSLLADTGVALLDGFSFGMDASSLTARLSYVDFNGGDILHAAAAHDGDGVLPESFIEEHAPRVWRGYAKIAEWVEEL